YLLTLLGYSTPWVRSKARVACCPASFHPTVPERSRVMPRFHRLMDRFCRSLERLRHVFDDLRQRLREEISRAVGETVSGAIRETVHGILGEPPVRSPPRLKPHQGGRSSPLWDDPHDSGWPEREEGVRWPDELDERHWNEDEAC